MIIYSITNAVNGKSYVGMTAMTLVKRWWTHKKAAKSGVKTALHSAIRLYGANNFAVSHIASLLPGLSRANLGELECIIIAQRQTLAPIGYNMTPGGDGLPAGVANPNLGRKCTPEHIAKTKLQWTPERRAAAAQLLRDRNAVMNQSAEHKAKLRASWKSAERRAAQSIFARNQGFGTAIRPPSPLEQRSLQNGV